MERSAADADLGDDCERNNSPFRKTSQEIYRINKKGLKRKTSQLIGILVSNYVTKINESLLELNGAAKTCVK